MAETRLTVKQIMDLGLWEKVCDYKGWDYWIVNEGRIEEDEFVTFDSEFKKVDTDNPFDIPQSLDDLIDEIDSASARYDFSEEYILENDLNYPSIGEFSYGTAYVPCSWVLPYLKELKKLKEK